MPSPSILDIARGYLSRGWTPVPVYLQDKRPAIPKGWPTLRYVGEDAAYLAGGTAVETSLGELFERLCNVGVVLGEASGGLVDVDLDCPEAVRLAPRLLPPTSAIFGRPSSLRAHWLYRAPGTETQKWAGIAVADNAGKARIPTLIELRSTGGQTVFPGSVHVSGEAIEWDSDEAPAVVLPSDLRSACQRVAVAALLVRSAGFTDDEAVLFAHDDAAIASLSGDLGKVIRPWLGTAPKPAPKRKAARPDEGTDDFREAVDRYNADHGRDYGQDGAGECPMCGYHRGFGRLRATGRWSCFAAPHVSAGGPGLKSANGDSYHGDALDIDAHAAGLSRDKLLVRDGYLRPPRQKKTNTSRPREDAPPWVPDEANAPYEEPVVREAVEARPPKPRPSVNPMSEAFSDLAAAQRFVASCGHNVRYVAGWRTWLVWDGARWQRDITGEVKRRCAQRAREFTLDVGRFGSNADIKSALGFEQSSRIAGALDFAAVQQEVAMRADAFDTHEWLLACPNGTVDLRTGQLRDAERSDLLTQCSPVPFDPDAKCPTFDTFLTEALPDAEVRLFVQRFLGYCLTGSIREQAMLIAIGGGRNGKGTLFETFSRALGSQFATPAPPNLLMAQRGGERHPTELADLKGRRLVYASEVPRGAAFSEQRVKWLTGGDTIKGRGMHENFSEFPPTHKLVVYVNDKPRVKDTTDSFWRRMRLVEFPVSFKGREDKLLPSKLNAELSGVLAWGVRGAADWYAHGLPEPASVAAATADYRTAEDPIARWVESRAERKESSIGLSDDLRADFNAWAQRTGEHEMSERGFGDALKAHEYGSKKTNKGRQWTLNAVIEEVTGSSTRHYPPQNRQPEHADNTGKVTGDGSCRVDPELDPQGCVQRENPDQPVTTRHPSLLGLKLVTEEF